MGVLRIDEVLAGVTGRGGTTGRVRLVGVDGPSGSGKSTLAARLAARSGAPVIEIDDFLSWSDLTGWWPRLERQVLAPLLAGSDAHYQARDWRDELGTSLDGWKSVPWAPVVIIEGVSSTRLAAADRLALRIWVEAPDDVRLRRGVHRGGESRRQLWLDFMEMEHAFFADDSPRDRADLLVDGNPSVVHDPGTELVTLD